MRGKAALSAPAWVVSIVVGSGDQAAGVEQSVVAEQRAYEVRGGESDEGDGAGHGHRGTGGQDDRDAAGQPDTGDRDTERLGRIVAEGQGVEGGREGQREQQAEDQGRQHRPQGVEWASGEGSGQPEARLVEGASAGQHDRRRPGQQHESEDRGAEGEPNRVDVSCPLSERLGEDGGSGGSGEGEPHVLDGVGEPEGEDGDDDRQTGARVDPEGGR